MKLVQNAAQTASVTADVVAVPPRSRVWFFLSATTARQASLMAAAALGWFRKSSIMATDKKVAIGLSIVKRVLELHGFAHGAEVLDGMNVFYFRMPVVE